MAKYSVRKIREEGRDKGKFGVYRGSVLVMVFTTKNAATAEKNHRNESEGSK